jgi:hypothetical protein
LSSIFAKIDRLTTPDEGGGRSPRRRTRVTGLRLDLLSINFLIISLNKNSFLKNIIKPSEVHDSDSEFDGLIHIDKG